MDLRSGVELAQKGWSQTDIEWLDNVKPDFQTIAVEYGRTIFALVMQAAQMTRALQKIQEASNNNPTLIDQCQLISESINNLYTAVLTFAKIQPERFVECQQALERRVFLLQGSSGSVKPTLPPSILVS